jgi:DnaJ-class molecular chaperone
MNRNRTVFRGSLEVPCDSCDGNGRRRKEGEWVRCSMCNGAGYIPTETGEKVLALMRHNFGPMLQDTTEK